jgi:hypothetical protein
MFSISATKIWKKNDQKINTENDKGEPCVFYYHPSVSEENKEGMLNPLFHFYAILLMK